MEAGLEWRSCRQVHDGNAQPQGFGHIGFIVDNLQAIEIFAAKLGFYSLACSVAGLARFGV